MKRRYEWIDNIRAIAMISMILYHMVWDLVYLYGMDWAWYEGGLARIWQQSICWTFILLSGFCWSFSKHPVKQGIFVSAAGALVTAVTCLFSYESRVVFGVLTMIGTAALLMIPLSKLFKKISPVAGAVLSFLIFGIFYGVNEGYLGFFSYKIAELPESWYCNLWTAFLGFPKPDFISADYFSIFPWIFLYMTGCFLYRIWLPEEKIPAAFLNRKIPLLTAMGKKALLIYLLHQPIIYAVLQLTFFSCNKLHIGI